MITLFDRLIQVAQLIGAIVAVFFTLFNLVRGIISGEFFPIFAFAVMSVLAFAFLGSSIKDITNE